MLLLPPPSTTLTPGLISRCPDKFKLLEPFIKKYSWGTSHSLAAQASLIIHKLASRQAPLRNGPQFRSPQQPDPTLEQTAVSLWAKKLTHSTTLGSSFPGCAFVSPAVPQFHRL